MRCSGCGNELPAWAGGVCYTCGRIRREEKRFGSHPSARKRAHQTPATPRAQVPSPGSVGSGFTLPPRMTDAESLEPPDRCPICGQEVPQDGLEEHIKLHTRPQRTHVSLRRTSKEPSRPASQPAIPRDTETPPPGNSAHGQTPLQARRQAINRLLAEINGTKYLLSDILRKGGISQADITRIHEERLVNFIDELLTIWRVAFAGELASGAWYVMTRSYGLDGVSPASDERLAEELAVPQQRVVEIRTKILKVLRAPASRHHLENLTVIVARGQLSHL